MSTTTTNPPTPLKVLLHMHPSHDSLDLIGPLEILSQALHPVTSTHLFTCTLTSTQPLTTSNQGATLSRDIPIEEAYATLSSFDILIIPGGSAPPVLAVDGEPIALVRAFGALPRKQDGGGRTLLSVCTGSLFLARAGVLKGSTATTHWGSYGRLRDLVAAEGGTQVVERRFVVNGVDGESGLRIITSGGISCGMDATLWLVESVAGRECREAVEKQLEYKYRGDEGLVLG